MTSPAVRVRRSRLRRRLPDRERVGLSARERVNPVGEAGALGGAQEVSG
jgi:hypothetical protein